jgi:hypothetical protein
VDSGFVVPAVEEVEMMGEENCATDDAAAAAAAGASDPSSSSSSSTPAPPVRILVHCLKGENRSVTIVLALLMLLYPSWSLDRAHRLLLSQRHTATCPFKDNRAELLAFERNIRHGVNSMTDKDFRTRIPADI